MPRSQVRPFGTALSFDGGTSSSVATRNAQLDFSGNPVRTIAFWLNPRSAGGGTLGRVFNKSGSNYALVQTLAQNNVRLTFNVDFTTTDAIASTGPSTSLGNIPLNKWTHVVAIINRNNDNKIEVLVNGAISPLSVDTAGVGSLSSDIFSGNDWNIGNNTPTTGTRGFDGKVDEFLIWNRAFSIAEAQSLYYQGTIPSGAVAHWKYDEGSGLSATDSSGNGNTGTITGATYTSDVPMVARPSAANRVAVRDFKASLGFVNQTTDRVSANAISGLGTASTVALWFNADTVSTTFQALFNNIESSASRLSLTLGTNTMRAGWYNGTIFVSPRTASNTPLKPGVWYHVVYTFDGTTGNLYINSVLDNSGAAGPSTNTNLGLKIGTRADLNIGFKGKIAETLVWGRVLTATEIQNLYTSGGISTSGLMGLWKLDEGAGTTANDSSGNANHGTITGATFSADVPMKARQEVNPNLVKNGNFEYAPPFVAATNVNGRWIDGTAGGSTSNELFDWHILLFSAPVGDVRFDPSVKYSGNNSLKITSSSSGAGKNIIIQQYAGSRARSTLARLPDILPNTQYRLSGYIKTDNVSNLVAGGGAVLRCIEDTIDAYSGIQNLSTPLTGTNDWTYVEKIFTTGASARKGEVACLLNAETGTAWFDNVELKPTTPVTRSAVV